MAAGMRELTLNQTSKGTVVMGIVKDSCFHCMWYCQCIVNTYISLNRPLYVCMYVKIRRHQHHGRYSFFSFVLCIMYNIYGTALHMHVICIMEYVVHRNINIYFYLLM